MNPRYLKPAGCAGCSLERNGFGFAVPAGPPGAPLTFVGEALGYEEAIQGEPFYGAAGGVLSRVLARAGIERKQVRIANVVSCRPPGDYMVGAPWEDHAIQQCRQYLQPVLDQVPDNGVVVPLGATALGAILNLRGQEGIAVKDFHGCIERDPSNRFWVVPSFHPSHLQRGAMNLLEVVTQDFQLAQRVADRGFRRSASELVIDPHPDWFRRWCEEYAAAVINDPDGCHLSLDTEFLEKSGGVDESEVVLGDRLSPLTRLNGGRDGVLGWTVPYRQPYIGIFDWLLRQIAAVRGWVWLWNKYADLTHLRAAGHWLTDIQFVDGMWLAHYLQSDLPRGLGFWAPMASDFGAWKHWGKIREREGEYAAADGLQNWRTCMWLLKCAIREGIWEMFLTDWHERDQYVLRPAHELGVPVNREELERFHQELQVKLGSILDRLKQTAAEGVLKPKAGYAKKPKGKACPDCGGAGVPPTRCGSCGNVAVDGICQNYGCEGGETIDEFVCATCRGTGALDPIPPASILGKPKKGGQEAKQQYMREGVRLVEKTIEVEITCCETCGAEDVGPKHRCPVPKVARPKRVRKGADHPAVPDAGGATCVGTVAAAPAESAARPVSRLVQRRTTVVRYFWQLPFNPDAPQQVLAYLESRGIDAPVDKKRGSKTTNKKALTDLKKQHRDDPFFELQLDWKAVQKVDSTYCVGVLTRLDVNDRIHPEFLPKPSTLRDSCVGVNLQNVVADKAGPDGLASGFRRCIEARDGLPPGTTQEEYDRWQERWG